VIRRRDRSKAVCAKLWNEVPELKFQLAYAVMEYHSSGHENDS
jgi:hypothetical protein